LVHRADSQADHFRGPDDSHAFAEQRLGFGPFRFEPLFDGAFRPAERLAGFPCAMLLLITIRSTH
jgi:hypothetical protein